MLVTLKISAYIAFFPFLPTIPSRKYMYVYLAIEISTYSVRMENPWIGVMNPPSSECYRMLLIRPRAMSGYRVGPGWFIFLLMQKKMVYWSTANAVSTFLACELVQRVTLTPQLTSVVLQAKWLTRDPLVVQACYFPTLVGLQVGIVCWCATGDFFFSLQSITIFSFLSPECRNDGDTSKDVVDVSALPVYVDPFSLPF